MPSTSGSTTVPYTPTGFALNSADLPPIGADLSFAKFCVYGPIFLFSVTGNTLVILTVVLLHKMKTAPMIFIANLAACDLITTLSSIPFDLTTEELGYWPYGEVMCKFLWPLATVSTNSAALTLIAISSDRYISIIYPLNLQCRITKGKCFKIIVCIHVVSALAVAPYVVFLRFVDGEVPTCNENWPHEYSGKIYTVFLFVLQYGLPLVVMTVIYTRIGCKLCKNSRTAVQLSNSGISKRKRSKSGPDLSDNAVRTLLKRKRQNDKTAKMFLFVVVIFLIFMMPHQLLWLSYDYFADTEKFIANEELIVFVCRAFTYANSVLNAIVYGVCNRNFRTAFLLILKCQCSKARQRNHARKQRGETLITNLLSRQRQDSCTSSLRTELDRKENGVCGNRFSMRKEVLANHALANGIKVGTLDLGRDQLFRHAKEGSGNSYASLKHEATNVLHVGVIKAAKYPTYNVYGEERSLDAATSAPDLDILNRGLHKSLVQNELLYLLNQTQSLLNKFCYELESGVSHECDQTTTKDLIQKIHDLRETDL